MKANELRIGNYLKFLNDDVFQVNCHDFEIIEHIPEKSHPLPIPLTEEWLVKFGFEKGNGIDVSDCFYAISVGGSMLLINPDNGIVWIQRNDFMFNNPCLIEHVHQLQNLYFALTGEELTIKEQ